MPSILLSRCSSAAARQALPAHVGMFRVHRASIGAGASTLRQVQTVASSRSRLAVHAQSAAASTATSAPPITLTNAAMSHLNKLQLDKLASAAAGAPADKSSGLLLRVGVRQGGCSGMSYHMDFESADNIAADDFVMTYEDTALRLVCDPKSLLYLFGMNLDYSDALIGGGFKFSNPNAVDTCGCGKSFGV